MCDDHPWTLTAPWWGWTKAGASGPRPRFTAPLLQKYDSSDPVSGFVKEPQKRLVFGDEDVVWRPVALAAETGLKRTRLSDWTLVKDGANTRKLFLPSHKRFYLVVCELHCDTAGLPSVSRDKVCETGFVVRRRSLSFAPEHAPAAQALVTEIGGLSAQIAALDRGGTDRLLKRRAKMTRGGVIGMIGTLSSPPPSGRVAGAVKEKDRARRDELKQRLDAARAGLQAWKTESGAVSVAEGWIPDADAENVGQWAVVDDRPSTLEEVIYPLSPLVPDPRKADHDAAGKTIWFGMLPGGSREVEVTGKARFDESTRYEVRCFVRRHRCDCPKTGERNDCGGELVWSAPTAVYQLAGHFDPVGTGNHPINIQMPDIPTLAATVGAKLPVAFHFPRASALNIQADKDGKPQNPSSNNQGGPGGGGMPQICFFSIPLITIIAMFVLNLFLPIVVFLFGLWFLLGLKFCILPSITLAGGVSLEVHADLDASIDLALSADIDVDADATLMGDLAADFNLLAGGGLEMNAPFPPPSGNPHFAPLPGTPGDLFTQGDATRDPPVKGYTNTAVAEMQATLAKDNSAEVDAGDVTASLVWVPRVERWEVGA